MIVLWPPPPAEKKYEHEKEAFLVNSCHLAV